MRTRFMRRRDRGVSDHRGCRFGGRAGRSVEAVHARVHRSQRLRRRSSTARSRSTASRIRSTTRLEQALQAEDRTFYRGGVVGPDGFPDTALRPGRDPPGQRRRVDAATSSTRRGKRRPTPAYGVEERKPQILAFGYGYATHAAGDMWAHTFVNDFARAVCSPRRKTSLSDTLTKLPSRCGTSSSRATSVTRRPGIDGNNNRTADPGRAQRGRRPTRSATTPPRAIAYGIPPDLFLWETFVGREPDAIGRADAAAGRPADGRAGPDHRLLLRRCATTSPPTPGRTPTSSRPSNDFNDLQDDIDYALEQCAIPLNPLVCPSRSASSASRRWATLIDATSRPARSGHRGDRRRLPRGVGRGHRRRPAALEQRGQRLHRRVVDPRAYHAYQDEKCGETGTGELSDARRICEDGVGLVGTFLDVLGESLTTAEPNLLSMLGTPTSSPPASSSSTR